MVYCMDCWHCELLNARTGRCQTMEDYVDLDENRVCIMYEEIKDNEVERERGV